MPQPAAVLDAMLKATGSPVVFGSAAPIYGKLRVDDVTIVDDGGVQLPINQTTLLIREGTQPAGLKNNALLTVAGDGYRVRDIGPVRPDGLRKLLLVARTN